jgi:hypothetical protein
VLVLVPMDLIVLALALVVFVRQRLFELFPSQQRRLFRLHTDRLVLLHPGPDVDTTVTGGLHGGDDPYAEKQKGDAEGDERDLVWRKPTELVVEHETVWRRGVSGSGLRRDARCQMPDANCEMRNAKCEMRERERGECDVRSTGKRERRPAEPPPTTT